MTEKQMVVLVRLIAEEVDDVAKKQGTSGVRTILSRLRQYSEEFDENAAKAL